MAYKYCEFMGVEKNKYENGVKEHIKEKEYIKKIEELRNRLHSTLDTGNKEEILIISKELDMTIYKFYKDLGN